MLCPVYVNGAAQLYDVYLGGKWYGSRTTFIQAYNYLMFLSK